MLKAEKNKIDVKYYMNLNYKMEIFEDKDEGGFVARYPELPGCIAQGETVNEVLKDLKVAKKVWIESMLDGKKEIFEPKNEENKKDARFVFSQQQKL